MRCSTTVAPRDLECMHKISICIPAYHSRAFLSDALSSVNEQVHEDWELIVVEDGSDDGTRQLVEEFGRSRIQSVRYERANRNAGTGSTRNRAVKFATGKFLAFLDSDDCWAPDHLSSLLSAILSSGAGYAFSGVLEQTDDNSQDVRERLPSEQELLDVPVALFNRCFIVPSAVLMRREVFESAGGFTEGQRHCEDLDLWLKLSRDRCHPVFSGLKTCHYRVHELAKTKLRLNMRLYRALVYSRHYDLDIVPSSVRRLRRTKAWMQTAWMALPKRPALSWIATLEACRGLVGAPPLSEKRMTKHAQSYDEHMANRLRDGGTE